MRTILYSRVSTLRDQKPEVQIDELRRFSAARGWQVTHEIVDQGFSGSTDSITRPGLKQLMGLARSRDVDAVVVVKLDRLFRSLKHLVTTLEEFQILGIAFVATRDQIDYTTPAGRLFVQILGSLAEFEKSLIVERTKMGIAHARSKGKVLGRPKKRNDAEILALRSTGMSYSNIAKQLCISEGSVYQAIKATLKVPQKTGANHKVIL